MVAARHRAPADLDEAVHALGISVWRSSDDEVQAHCPGHLERLGREDSHPTWSVNRVSGLHNCYSCGFRGTFLELVMYLLYPNDVFRAARWLRQYGSDLGRAIDLPTFAERQDSDARVAEVELVPETKLAMYADVPDWALEARMLSRDSVAFYGVRWNERRDSWIIPIREPGGDLLGWQEKWQTKRRFINAPKEMRKSATLFGLQQFPVGEPAVVLESPLDVLRLHTAGWEGGLATFGAEISDAQIDILQEVTDELVSALDDDDAGRKAAEELRVGRWERGRMVRPSLRKNFNLRFFEYGRSGAKDIGAMQDTDINYGLYNAQHATVASLGANPEQERKQRGLHRNAKGLPGQTGRAHGRPRAVPADSRRRMPDGRHRGRNQPPG